MSQFMQYKSVPISNVENVEIIPSESQEWRDYRRSLFDKNSKTLAQKERAQNVANHRNRFRRFKKDVKYLLDDESKLVEKLEYYTEHRKQAQFDHAGMNKYGNRICATPDEDYEKYNIINRAVHWKKTNYNRKTGKTEVNVEAKRQTMKALKQHGYNIVEEEEYRSPEKYALPELYDNSVRRLKSYISRMESDGKRNEVLRFCWHRHLSDVEDFNINRAEAYLRDMGASCAEEHSGSGNDNAIKFEDKARDGIHQLGMPLRNRVLKIETKHGKTRYKELDIHTDIYGKPLIIEVYTNRDEPAKKKQLRNYVRLYRKATGILPEGLLLTEGVDLSHDPYYQGHENAETTLSVQKIREALNSDSYPKLKLTEDFTVEAETQ